jgi:hypothetical protein
MDSRHLTNRQLETIAAEIERQISYLTRLRARMVETGFPADDQLLAAVNRASEATTSLHLQLLLCRSGLNERSVRSAKRARKER